MTSIDYLKPKDFMKFSSTNLDVWTETFNFSYIMRYILQNYQCNYVIYDENDCIMGYFLGKFEQCRKTLQKFAHVSALTVSPTNRRLGLATYFMQYFENLARLSKCYWVDLYVRKSNLAAIGMYKSRGYKLHETYVNYYFDYYTGDHEDGYDMRKTF